MSAPAEVVATIPKNANETIKVSLSQFHGHTLADVRVFAPVAGMDCLCPTKKGVSIRLEMVDELIAALSETKARAAALGWWQE